MTTKFDTMVAEAFQKKQLPATIEIQDGKVISVRYTHNIDFIRDSVQYLVTTIDPASVFKEVIRNNEIVYEEISLDEVIKKVQAELNDILVVDVALEKLRLHFGDILKKPDIEVVQEKQVSKKAA